MSHLSKIEWTESTWNPVTGCTKISTGCKHCYAERLAKRLKAMGQANYKNGFEVTLHEHMLTVPLNWKKPQVIFVNSMSDLFHQKVPLDFIAKVFQIIGLAEQHRFQVLTKRAGRLERLAPQLKWHSNLWMGVTVEHMDHLDRVDSLLKVPAALKFLSLEPLLGPMDALDLEGIDWVILGGESGPGARPLALEWVRSVRDKCLEANVPFFFKQWGGVNKKKAGRLLDGITWEARPAA